MIGQFFFGLATMFRKKIVLFFSVHIHVRKELDQYPAILTEQACCCSIGIKIQMIDVI